MKHWIDYDDFAPRGTCSVAAAIIGGAALTAGSSIYGSITGRNAQVDASNRAIGAQREMFGEARNALSPFINMGQQGIERLTDYVNPGNESSPLNALMRLVMPGSNQSETLAQTPGYQFAEDRGLRAVNNALAARGLGGSGGPVARGASEYVTGLASNTWQSVVNALMNTFTGGTSALQGVVNTGANAGGNLAGGAITSGNNIAGNMVGVGNAQAGAATAIGNAAGGVGNSLTTAALIQRLLGNSGGAPSSGSVYGVPDYQGQDWAAAGAGQGPWAAG